MMDDIGIEDLLTADRRPQIEMRESFERGYDRERRCTMVYKVIISVGGLRGASLKEMSK